ncbi:MAG TPA: helicase-associated domain-containing protein [Ktedonobacteraceae bacterium]
MVDITAALRKALQACSAEELSRVGEKWAVAQLVANGNSGRDEERRLLDIISARFAWDALSENARSVLHQMITFKVMDGVPREDLQALTSLTEAEFVAALIELEQSIMLIEIRPDAKVKQRLETRAQQITRVLAIPKDFHAMFTTIDKEMYGPFGDLSKMQLADVLAALDTRKLQTIHTLTTLNSGDFGLGFYTLNNSTDHLAKSVAGKLVQPKVIELIWEKLDATEQQICRWLCRADGSAEVAQAQAALNLSRAELARSINRLENNGLAFDTFSGQEHKIFVGRGTFKVLRKFINELDRLQEQAQRLSSAPDELEEVPVLIHDAQSQLLYDLAIVINAVYQMAIEPTQAGKVPKRLANRIFPLLHGSRPNYYEETDYYLDMVFMIAKDLELLQVKESLGQKARYMPGPKLEEWGRLEAFEQTRRLLMLWERAAVHSWSDIAGVNYRPDNYGYGSYIEAHSSRQGLLAYLAENCQPGRWYTLLPFLQRIKLNNLFLLREHSRYASYGGTRNRKDVLANWDHLDAEIVTGILSSSLHELGLVTLGYLSTPAFDDAEELKNPDAFQFTELAAQAMWNMRPAQQESSSGERARTLIVQPNFELLLLQPDYPTLYKLLPFTRIAQVEMVSRLTLTQESVRRGVEAGHGVEQIVSILQACSQKELPQNVLYTLQDWGRLYKDATVSQVLLLEVGSEAIADEICASPKFRTLELRRLGPCAIVIGGQVSLQVLRTTLEKEGVILHIQGDILSAREFASAVTSGYGRQR